MAIISNTIEGVTQLIREATEKATGWTTIIGPVQGPEPANQYCVVTNTNHFKQPHDVISYTQIDGNLTEKQRGESTLYFEIQARGFGAMDALDKVTSYLDSPQRDVDLWPYVGSGGHDDSQNISTYHQGKILEVAVVTININAALTKENSVEWMNCVDIDVNRDNNHIVTIRVPDAEQNQGE